MTIKTDNLELKSWEIPLFGEGYILVIVEREQDVDEEVTVPHRSVLRRNPQFRVGLLNTRFKFRIDQYNTVDSETTLVDTLLQIGWVKSDVIPILPWMAVINAIEIIPEVQQNSVHISHALEDLEIEFEKLK